VYDTSDEQDGGSLTMSRPERLSGYSGPEKVLLTIRKITIGFSALYVLHAAALHCNEYIQF